MFDLPAVLAPACVRTLRTCSARDHAEARHRRHGVQRQAHRTWYPRKDRLSRAAALVFARAVDMRAEVRA